MVGDSEDGPFQEPFKELQEEIIEVVNIDELLGVSDAPNKTPLQLSKVVKRKEVTNPSEVKQQPTPKFLLDYNHPEYPAGSERVRLKNFKNQKDE